MMRIGLLTPSLRGFNAVDGGIASHFAELAAALTQAGASVQVFVTAENAPASTRAAAGYEIIAAKSRLSPWLNRVAGRPWQLHTLLSIRHRAQVAARLVLASHDARPVDVIETSSSGLLASRLLRSHRRPPVVTRVSTTADQLVTHNLGAADWHTRLENHWERALVVASDSIVTHTREHRELVCAEWQIPPARVALVPHGISLPPADALPAPGENPAPVILFVGRFERRKGIDTLLAALPAVLARHTTAVAVLAGHDADDFWQTQFWRENPSLDRRRVTFTGRVATDELIRLLRSADIFVAPSRYESFGLVYVEAMAWAKPAIGCNAGGVPEVIVDGETGFLISPGDSAALVGCLGKLLADPGLRARLGAAGRRRAERLFSSEALAAASLAHYAEVIGNRRTARE